MAHNWLTSSGLTDEGKIVSLVLEAFAEKYNNVENSLEIHTRLMNFKKTLLNLALRPFTKSLHSEYAYFVNF